MATPRLYLFYGNHSWASHAAVIEWRKRFQQKYGQATFYLLEADELTLPLLSAHLTNYLQAQALFPTPVFILVKRLSHLSDAQLKTLLTSLIPQAEQLDQQVTLAVWEERDLGPNHPLLSFFQKGQDAGWALVKRYSLPETRSQLTTVANKQLALSGLQLSDAAAAWLFVQYQRLGQEARMAKRLKSGELLLEDQRGWWLHQILEGAVLRATGAVEEPDLSSGHYALLDPVGPFAIATALVQGRFTEGRRLTRQLLSVGDESAGFGLLAALRWQFGKTAGGSYPLQLLAELEIIAKNFSLPLSWLFDLFLYRLESGGDNLLLEPRTLWLAQLPKA